MAGNMIYAISIAQFLLGCIITVLNLILWIAIAVNPVLRTAAHCLLGNMFFANLLLGVIVAIANVVDQSDVYVFQKTEGTVAIVNGFVTVSMLLALTTNRVITIRNPAKSMSTKTSFKLIAAVWIAVLCLTLIKAIVFGLDKIGVGACFKCFLSFEVSTLVIFTAATLGAFFISVFLICCHRNRTVGDSVPNPDTAAANGAPYQKEYRTTLTIGLLLFGFSVTFMAFVFLIPAWLTNGSLDRDAAEIIITLFYTHSLINPIIALFREPELRKSARRIICCKRSTPAIDTTPPAPPPIQTNINGSRHSMNTGLPQVAMQMESNGYQQPLQPPRTPSQLPPIETPGLKARGIPPVDHSDDPRKVQENIEEEKFKSFDESFAPTAPPIEKEKPRAFEV